VNTFAGAQLGVAGGTLTAWLGMTLGASFGFALARWLGRPLVEWMISADDLPRVAEASRRFGPQLVVITRALPVLAEATVLLLGSARLEWRRFLPAMALSNLGLAVVYAAFGYYARQQGMVVVALAVSIALPVLAATIARRLLSRHINQ
jgi:3-dehydroquinate synthase